MFHEFMWTARLTDFPNRVTQQLHEVMQVAENKKESQAEAGDYSFFEGVTGVKAGKWRDLDQGKTKTATAEMIEELGRYWPEFAFWFVTGKATSLRGQTTPTDYIALSYGTVRVLESGGFELWREVSCKICRDLGNLGIDPMSNKYKVSVAQRILELNRNGHNKVPPSFLRRNSRLVW